MIDGSTWSPVRSSPYSGSTDRDGRRCGPACARPPIRAPRAARVVRGERAASAREARTTCASRGSSAVASAAASVLRPPHGVSRPTAPIGSACRSSGCRATGRRRSRRCGRRPWEHLVGLDVECLRRHRGDAFGLGLFLLRRHVVASARLFDRPGRERLVRDQLGAGLLADATRATEVVGMRVRDDHGVHVRSLKPAVLSRCFSAFHDCGPGRPGSTTARPRSSSEAVHVHVTETGHPDRELHAEHVRRHFGDVRGRGVLFLFVRPGRHARVARPTMHVGHDSSLPVRPVRRVRP